MKFGYTIIYVPNVSSSIAFFEKAFGLSLRFLHESGDYGELNTGETTLAFPSLELGNSKLPSGFVPANSSTQSLGFEVAFVSSSVSVAHAKALSCGAIVERKAPETKPWGQVVSYVRCPDGTLVELCSSMGS